MAFEESSTATSTCCDREGSEQGRSHSTCFRGSKGLCAGRQLPRSPREAVYLVTGVSAHLTRPNSAPPSAPTPRATAAMAG